MTEVIALEVRNRVQSRLLEIRWSDQLESVLSHQTLRNRCRCAFCSAKAMRGIAVNASDGIALIGIAPIGAYGVQLSFSDGHTRGIYPWVYLRMLSAPSGLVRANPVPLEQRAAVAAVPGEQDVESAS